MSQSSPCPSFFHDFGALADPSKLSNESQRKANLVTERARQRAKESKELRRQAVLDRQRARSEIAPFSVDCTKIPLPELEPEEDEIKQKETTLLDLDDVPVLRQHFTNGLYKNIEKEKEKEQKEQHPSPKPQTPKPMPTPKPQIPTPKPQTPIPSPVASYEDAEEEIRRKIKIENSVNRFQKCEQKGSDAQNVATKQTTMVLLFLTGLFESANKFTGEKLLKMQNLSVNVQAALNSGEFNKFIESIASHPLLIEFFQNPLSGFATTMAQITMDTHTTNLKKLETVPTNVYRRNVQDEKHQCNCHDNNKPIPQAQPNTQVPWSLETMPADLIEKLTEKLTKEILAKQQQQSPFVAYPYYYPPIPPNYPSSSPMNYYQQVHSRPLPPLSEILHEVDQEEQEEQKQDEQLPKQEQLKQQKEKQEQLKQEQLKQEQLKQEQLKQEQLKQEQLKQQKEKQQKEKQEQLKQEQLKQQKEKQEQLKQEQLKQEQLKQKQINELKTNQELKVEDISLSKSNFPQILAPKEMVIDPKLGTPRPRFQPDLPKVNIIGTEQFGSLLTTATQSFAPFIQELAK